MNKCGNSKCLGFFIDVNDNTVNRCDMCAMFKNDRAAAKFLIDYVTPRMLESRAWHNFFDHAYYNFIAVLKKKASNNGRI